MIMTVINEELYSINCNKMKYISVLYWIHILFILHYNIYNLKILSKYRPLI